MNVSLQSSLVWSIFIFMFEEFTTTSPIRIEELKTLVYTFMSGIHCTFWFGLVKLIFIQVDPRQTLLFLRSISSVSTSPKAFWTDPQSCLPPDVTAAFSETLKRKRTAAHVFAGD